MPLSFAFTLIYVVRKRRVWNDIQQLLAASVQSLTHFISTGFARTQPLARNFKEPYSI
jgi:hypothetical protein